MASGAMDSDLSNPRFGYDVVCAVTQEALDATVKAFLGTQTFDSAKEIYVATGASVPTRISYEDFMVKSKGTDPFYIPADADPNDEDGKYAAQFLALQKAKFMFAFEAKMGLPPGVPPPQLTVMDFVEGSNHVLYNMYCSVFKGIMLQYPSPLDEKPEYIWTSVSQPDGAPWVCKSSMSLDFEKMDNFSKLPADVQRAIANAGGAQSLSVQQLIFNLQTAMLQTIPKMEGLPAEIEIMVSKTFLGAYFQQMKAKGQPLLWVSATSKDKDSSDFRPTALIRSVNPYQGNANPADAKRLTTLNYLCACFDSKMLPAVQFPWNWVKPQQSRQIHGVMSVNRNTLATWYLRKLWPIAIRNSFQPWTNANIRFGWPFVKLEGELLHSAPNNKVPPPVPIVIHPTTGSVVLKIEWNAEKESTCRGGVIEIKPEYKVSVAFSGNQIIIVQRLACYLYAEAVGSSLHANVVDYNVTDVYDLAVKDGQLIAKFVPGTLEDKSESPSVNWFVNAFTGLNSIRKTVQENAKMRADDFDSIPVEIIQDFMFPGGRVFKFSDVQFSDYQDLTASIVYASPAEQAMM